MDKPKRGRPRNIDPALVGLDWDPNDDASLHAVFKELAQAVARGAPPPAVAEARRNVEASAKIGREQRDKDRLDRMEELVKRQEAAAAALRGGRPRRVNVPMPASPKTH